ncbi:hypothetical protein SAMN04489841_1400 [Natrinema salaciae]|uniref:Uncharacterized protein n=1 Tax=Natrinema salaciae TaxID=1186196 RepID=A0A1H9EXK6_9EURY|nr:hypothetical protein SAMN04489841_1400 [Natrinema salaciae]
MQTIQNLDGPLWVKALTEILLQQYEMKSFRRTLVGLKS